MKGSKCSPTSKTLEGQSISPETGFGSLIGSRYLIKFTVAIFNQFACPKPKNTLYTGPVLLSTPI